MTNPNHTDTSRSGYQGSSPEPNTITFWQHDETQLIMTIHADGRIELSDRAKPTEAAALCVEAMSDLIQGMILRAKNEQTDRIEALEAENERLRARLAHAEDDCDDDCIYCEERRQEIASAALGERQ